MRTPIYTDEPERVTWKELMIVTAMLVALTAVILSIVKVVVDRDLVVRAAAYESAYNTGFAEGYREGVERHREPALAPAETPEPVEQGPLPDVSKPVERLVPPVKIEMSKP